MVFRVLVILDLTLYELQNRLCDAVRQNEPVYLNVLQDGQLPPPTGARALNAP